MFPDQSDYIYYSWLASGLPLVFLTMISAIVVLYVKVKNRRQRWTEFFGWVGLMLFGGLTLTLPGILGIYSLGLGIALFILWDILIAVGMYHSMFVASKSFFFEKSSQEGSPTTFFNAETPKEGEHRGAPEQVLRDIVRRARKVIVAFFAVSSITGLVTGVTCGYCYVSNPREISTMASRSNFVCGEGMVCHLYFTVGPTCDSMYLVAHATMSSSVSAQSNMKFVVTADGSAQRTFPSPSVALRNDYFLDKRMVITQLVDKLPPATVVNVQFTIGGAQAKQDKFKSLPCGTEPVKFWVGGDIATDEKGWGMCKAAMEFDSDTHLVIIGGDIAYDNSIRACYNRYDTLLKNWILYMRRGDNALLPIIFGVGNHDVGGYERSYKPAFYTDYFPATLDDPTLPAFHTHMVSDNVGVLIADSGHLTSVGGQRKIIEDTLASWKSKNIAPLVIYHVPAYPSQRAIDSQPSRDVREMWTPIFDKYNLSVAFENHDHTYKRTFPIANQAKVAPGKGTVYIGDGAWGVGGIRETETERWYIEKGFGTNYGCLTIVSAPNNYNVTVISDTKQILDSWNSIV